LWQPNCALELSLGFKGLETNYFVIKEQYLLLCFFFFLAWGFWIFLFSIIYLGFLGNIYFGVLGLFLKRDGLGAGHSRAESRWSSSLHADRNRSQSN